MIKNITYKIQEYQFNLQGEGSLFDLTIEKIEYEDHDDENWFMRFNSLAEAYAQIAAFASKYHLGLEVKVIQAEPIYHYDREAS